MLPVSITQRENISVNRISWRLYQYKLKSKVIKIEVCIRASLYMFLIHSMDYKHVNFLEIASSFLNWSFWSWFSKRSTTFDRKVITALWMNFIGELSVLLSGTIIRPTKINDMNTDGKKNRGKRRNMNIYTKKKTGRKGKRKRKIYTKKGKGEKGKLIYTKKKIIIKSIPSYRHRQSKIVESAYKAQ